MDASQAAWTDVVTALVAGAALVLSIVSLVVQYVLWRNSGARVAVSSTQGFLAWTNDDLQDILTITASNRGRQATQVTNWWLEPRNGDKHWWFRENTPGSAPLPALLESGHEAKWMVNWQAVVNVAQEVGAREFRPAISLGSGETVVGDWHDISSWTGSHPS